MGIQFFFLELTVAIRGCVGCAVLPRSRARAVHLAFWDLGGRPPSSVRTLRLANFISTRLIDWMVHDCPHHTTERNAQKMVKNQ
jgi:hypothetical protein